MSNSTNPKPSRRMPDVVALEAGVGLWLGIRLGLRPGADGAGDGPVTVTGPGLWLGLRPGADGAGDGPVTVTGLGLVLAAGVETDNSVTVNSASCATVPALLVTLVKVIVAE